LTTTVYLWLTRLLCNYENRLSASLWKSKFVLKQFQNETKLKMTWNCLYFYTPRTQTSWHLWFEIFVIMFEYLPGRLSHILFVIIISNRIYSKHFYQILRFSQIICWVNIVDFIELQKIRNDAASLTLLHADQLRFDFLIDLTNKMHYHFNMYFFISNYKNFSDKTN
jgi:hypothetical protein